jgi:transposase-like protein
MQPQEISIELSAQGARRATGEGSTKGWKKPQRFSAQKKTEVVLRLLRGETLDLLSRELGMPAARIATWREAFLDAGQEAMKKQPLDGREREIARLREKLGESTMDIELLREKLERFETGRPLVQRRSRR